MSEILTPAPLLTMSESDYRWCRDLQRAEHAAFSLVLQYLGRAATEIDAQRAEVQQLREANSRLSNMAVERRAEQAEARAEAAEAALATVTAELVKDKKP